MSTTAPPAYVSGHCSVGGHDRCRGTYSGVTCQCACGHQPPEVAVHCALGCHRHVETGTDPSAVHAAMERHYAAVHPEPVALHHCPTCSCVGTA